MSYYINSNCTRCDACVKECPTGSIIAAEPTYVIDADTCTDSRSCVAVCPVDAILRLPTPRRD